MYWMGFARDRAAGTYRMFNPATRKVIRTRDVRFTKPASVNRNPGKDGYNRPLFY